MTDDFYQKKLDLCVYPAKLWLALCMWNDLSIPADSLII